eukprot:TRINITY_DN50419_c0_g1_i1.p1 TRINITY_DN50419_c0_g1~~TRINITY_DN50419_c0_g1_i1.p1  ORF type:complete len:515 (+),score=222.49 TRINITY_DN50419_c0_g1_i1:30-1574(+)
MSGSALHEKMWEGMINDCIQTPSTVKYAPLAGADLTDRKALGIVGTKPALEALAKAGSLPDEVTKGLNFLLGKLDGSKKLESLSHYLTEGGVAELRVGCVSQEASRSVAPHRPDQVLQFTKRISPDAKNALILAVPSDEAFFSYAAAVPRGHPLCQLKGANDAFLAEGRETLDVFTFHAGGGDITAKQLEEAQIVAESIQLTARLVDTPANYLNTKTYAKIVEGLAQRFKFGLQVIRGEELQAKGMNVIYHVGRAAEYASALCVLSYTPESAPKDKVACWCGKGIVYDTGGLSIKTTAGMCGMKRDMGGSAGVLGGFLAAVRLGLPVTLHALLALADNAVNEKSLRNDDVVRCLSGRTIEINNTDAEGRLVLCDAVAYAHQTFNPTTVLEMATLTGAQGIATGKHFAAIVANNDGIEKNALAAGLISGDQCFPCVFAPELLLDEFDSKIADMKNSVASRTNAQVSCAGLFIYEAGFAGKYTGDWLHVDMAYPVETDGRGTGWGVGFLVQLASKL